MDSRVWIGILIALLIFGSMFICCYNSHDNVNDLREVYDTSTARVGVYVITYNCPDQFRVLLESLNVNNFISQSQSRIVLNNSTDRATDDMYAQLCAMYGFVELKQNNIGITGGRKFLAEHFAKSDLTHYYYFEDDMLLTTDQKSFPVCPYTYPRFVPNLFQNCLDVALSQGLDYLKLSYCEVVSTNYFQIAEHDFQRYDNLHQLPPVRIDGTYSCGVYPSLKYAVGEFYYCNWPALMTQRANRVLFIDHVPENRHERTYLVYSVNAIRNKLMTSGCLLACLVDHARQFDYNRETRLEF